MKQSLSYNQELINVQYLLDELITEITALKVVLPEDQKTLTEAQVFFNGGVESAIKKIRKTDKVLKTHTN
jgi:predicted secreted protein